MHFKPNEKLVDFVEKHMSGLTEDLVKRGLLTSDTMIDIVQEKVNVAIQEFKEAC